MKAVNLADKFALFKDHWSPRIVAQVNDLHIKTVKLHGEFVWHSHAETDEMFWVHRGEVTIEFRDGEATLREGEMLVVPRGVEHRPVAREECELVLIEPAGTINTGDAGGDRTVANDVWI